MVKRAARAHRGQRGIVLVQNSKEPHLMMSTKVVRDLEMGTSILN